MNTALPKSIREQAARSNALMAKQASGQPITQEDLTGPLAISADPPMPKGFQPQPGGAQPMGGADGKFVSQGAAPQPAAPAPAPAPAAAPAPTMARYDEDWEHRFKVLQGKYNAEVPRLHQETRELRGLLANMQAPAPQPAPAPAPAPQAERRVTDAEVKEFGPDLYDFVKRAAEEVVAPRARSLEEQFRPVAQAVQQITPMVQQNQQELRQTAAQLVHNDMCDTLDQAVPNWEQVNTAPEFIAWLEQIDPFSGEKRGGMLATAYRSNNVPRVVAFFTGFLKENAAVAPQGQQPAPAAGPQVQQPQVPLANLAAPGTGVGGPTTAGAPNESGQPRVYTTAEISAFYRDAQKGQYRGREAEKRAIEADIFQAQKQGRVRP